MAKDDLTINIKTNVKDASKGTEDLAKNTGEATKETTLLSAAMGKFKLAMAAAGKTAKMLFGSIKAGIMSTGIGALVLAVVALFSYFTKTQRGAEMLERAMAGLGAAMDVVTDIFSRAGEVMVGAFKDPQQAIADLRDAIKKNLTNRLTGLVDGFMSAGKIIQAALKFDWDTVKEGAKEYGQALIQVNTGLDVEQQKAFADGVKNIADEMEREVAIAMQIKRIQQGIREEEMAFSKVQAQTRQEVAKARLDAMDETKTEEERLNAINKVMEKENQMTQGLIALQQKKVDAKREENALGESMMEDKEDLMALEVELINLTTQSTMTQKRLMTEVEALQIQMASKKKARAKVEAEAAKVMNEEELAAAKLLSDEKLALAITDAKEKKKADDLLVEMRNENILAEIEDLKERALKELEIQKELELAKLKSHENFEELKAEINKKYNKKADKVNKKFSEDEVTWEGMTQDQKMKKRQEGLALLTEVVGKESAVGKAAAIANATIDTYKGATSAYASMSGIPVVGPALGAVAAGAAIAAGIANVKAIMATGDGGGGGGGGGGGVATPSAPSVSGGTPSTTVSSGAFTLGEGLEPEPARAYVVSDDITNSQSQLANIRRRATI